jgi:thiamine biosynthesis lipoprotein
MFFSGAHPPKYFQKETKKEMRAKEVYAFIFLMLVLAGCQAPKDSLKPIVYRWPVMGTFYEVNWLSPESNQEELSKLMFEKIRWVDEKVSTYKSHSDLSKLNTNAGGSAFLVDPVTEELLKISVEYKNQTDGWFDISTGAMVKLWKLNEPVRGEQKEIPSNSRIEKVLGVVRNTIINLKDQKASINPKGAYLDMGAIAKGFALDTAYELSVDAACGFMNLGRQLMMVGKCRTPLQFGVQNPMDETKIIASIELSTGSISTSGSYERYFSHNNRKYAHIINPKTGYPVDTNLLSVTVWSKNATDADVWSTALFVAGFEEGTKIMERNKMDIGVLWIFKDQKTIYRDSSFGRVIVEK